MNSVKDWSMSQGPTPPQPSAFALAKSAPPLAGFFQAVSGRHMRVSARTCAPTRNRSGRYRQSQSGSEATQWQAVEGAGAVGRGLAGIADGIGSAGRPFAFKSLLSSS